MSLIPVNVLTKLEMFKDRIKFRTEYIFLEDNVENTLQNQPCTLTVFPQFNVCGHLSVETCICLEQKWVGKVRQASHIICLTHPCDS